MLKHPTNQKKKEKFAKKKRKKKRGYDKNISKSKNPNKIGILYVVFNLISSVIYLKNTIDYQTAEFHPVQVDMSGFGLIIFGAPVNFVIYIIWVKRVKYDNPKPVKYFLILPGFFLIITHILYLIYSPSYFWFLRGYFIVHTIIGGGTFLYFKF